jgi:hypothetical protein
MLNPNSLEYLPLGHFSQLPLPVSVLYKNCPAGQVLHEELVITPVSSEYLPVEHS